MDLFNNKTKVTNSPFCASDEDPDIGRDEIGESITHPLALVILSIYLLVHERLPKFH
jgi:hypothetical protein